MTYTERTLLALSALSVVFCFIFLPLGLFLLGIVLVGGSYALKKVEADPATIAISEVWGSPKPVLVEPRYVFVIEPLEGLIILPGGQIILEFIFEGVSCGIKDPTDPTGKAVMASGGFVTVAVALIGRVIRNPTKAYQFVVAGKEAGVREIASDRFEQAVREFAAMTDWETLRAGKKELGKELEKLVREDEPDQENEFNVRGFETIQIIVKSVEPEGTLKEDAQNFAREFQQRRTESMDIDTGIALAKKYTAADPTMTFKEGEERVRLRRNPNAKEVFVRGLEANPLAGLGALSNPSLFGENRGSK